jgi:hypothetical protein
MVAVWGQPPDWLTDVGPGMSFSGPERARFSCAELAEARRGLPSLQPLFPHLGAAVLEDVKEFERRPESAIGDWAEPLRRWYRLSDQCPAPKAAMTPQQQQAWDRMSENERALRSGGLQRRLINLAVTGRITEEEFHRLVNRLQGN